MDKQALETRIAIIVEHILERRLKEIQNLTVKYYTPADIAEMLNVSAQMIRRLCNSGDIHSIRVGTEIRIERKALLKSLETFE